MFFLFTFCSFFFWIILFFFLVIILDYTFIVLNAKETKLLYVKKLVPILKFFAFIFNHFVIMVDRIL